MYTAKQMIVMRRDLHMRKGKIAAQAGHACVTAVLMALERENRLGQVYTQGMDSACGRRTAPPPPERLVPARNRQGLRLCGLRKRLCWTWTGGPGGGHPLRSDLRRRHDRIPRSAHFHLPGPGAPSSGQVDPLTGELPLY